VAAVPKVPPHKLEKKVEVRKKSFLVGLQLRQQ
jgi:hypothetical protein